MPPSPTVLFLGTGTSTGVPLIGCSCPVCTSPDPRDNRLRSSVLVQHQGFTLLIDATPDFRQQALRHKFPRIDAVLVTHAHVDHVFGLDDIRRFNTIQGERIPVYSSAPTRDILNRTFYYLSATPFPGGYLPQIDFHDIRDVLTLGALSITPVPVEHGNDLTWGYKITTGGHSLAYIPDCARIPDASLALIRDIDTLILDALRVRPHGTHMTIEQSVRAIQSANARRGYLTHLGHDLSHEQVLAMLPPNIQPAYDGLTI